MGRLTCERRDHSCMGHTSNFSAVDPAFVDVAKAVFGDAIDARELWDISKLDGADVHVNTAVNGNTKQKKQGGHSKTGAALLLGTAAEGDAAYNAGKSGVAAAKGVDEFANAANKVRAVAVGRGALQATNLGVGLIAAHALLRKPKTMPVNEPKSKTTVDKAIRVAIPRRPVKIHLTDAQVKQLKTGRNRGTAMFAGVTTTGTAGTAHHLGVRHERKLIGEQPSDLTKAFRTKPLNPGNVPRVVSLKARKVPMAPPLSKGYFSKPKHAQGVPRPHEPQHLAPKPPKPAAYAPKHSLKATPITPPAATGPVEAAVGRPLTAVKSIKTAGRSLRPLGVAGGVTGGVAAGALAATVLAHRNSSVSKSSIGLFSPAEVEHRTGLHDQHLRDAKRYGMMDADNPNPLKASRSRYARSAPGPAGRGEVTEVVSNYWSAKGGKRRPKVRLITRGIAKAAEPQLSWTGEISKIDPDKRQVFGWCSLSKVDGQEVVDLQGDFVPLDEIEKSAYKYVIESRKGGDMHRRVRKFDVGDEPLHTADLIESFVVTPDKLRGMGLAEDALPHGWWVGFKVNDEEQWTKVRNGERAGFSIHGTGQRRPAA